MGERSHSLSEESTALKASNLRRWLSVALWWVITLAFLLLLDDLLVGPMFWAIARWQGPYLGFVLAFTVSVVTQVYMVRAGTRACPSRVARFLLRSLDLQRRSKHVRDNEHKIRTRVLGGGSAVVAAPVVGGALPPLILWRSGFDRAFVRKLSILTASLYAVEFGLLYGWLPGTIGR